MTKNWLIRRVLRRFVSRALARYGRGRLLDVGCGSKPYRLYGSNVSEWLGTDTPASTHPGSCPDVIAPAEELPFGPSSFNTVLCTQVLEHVRYPERALDEMCRVLVPGGHLILTTDFVWHAHADPVDYWRFVPGGMPTLLRDHGFDLLESEVPVGFYGLVCQEIAYRLFDAVPGNSRWGIKWVAGALAQPAQIAGCLLSGVGCASTFGAPLCVVACKS
jgi:SAM-dependent methyltransferase